MGNDFRRPEVLASWQNLWMLVQLVINLYLLTLLVAVLAAPICNTLAEVIAKQAGTCGLAFAIHRSVIGLYDKENRVWQKFFRPTIL